MPKVFTPDKLLNLVSQHRFLFDKNEKKFKNKVLKEDTWYDIGKTFGLSGDQAMKKFKSMKDYYARIKKNAETNGGAEEGNWMYFNLVDRMLNENSIVTVDVLKENGCSNGDVNPEETCEVEFTESSEDAGTNETNNFNIDIKVLDSTSESVELADLNTPATFNQMKRRKTREDEADRNSIETHSVNKARDTKRSKTEEYSDEISSFAKYLEAGLRNLPTKRARLLIKKFNNDLSDELIHHS